MKDHVRKNYEENIKSYERMAQVCKGDEKAYAERMIKELKLRLNSN